MTYNVVLVSAVQQCESVIHKHVVVQLLSRIQLFVTPRTATKQVEMATYSSILAWAIPWTEEPGRLQSIGLQKSRTRLSD